MKPEAHIFWSEGHALALVVLKRQPFPALERVVTDAGYQAPEMEAPVAQTGTWRLETVRRCDWHRFVVLPRRRIVEVVFTQMAKPDVFAVRAYPSGE